MVKLPLLMARKAESILIIGGGDGLASKEALNFPSIKKITNVELDPLLCGLVKIHPVMRRISNNSFNHPKVDLVVGDGIRYLINSNKKYDVIIDDCDVDVTTQPGGITDPVYEEYLRCLVTKLTPGGIFCIMDALGSINPLHANYTGRMPDSHEKRTLWLNNVLKSANYIQEWKKHTPYIAYALVDSFIGPEVFIYGSNEPIKFPKASP
jgi:spermidine synthase